MSVVRINVLQVPAERAEVLEQRFAARAGEVDQVDGFESFDLLRPTDGTDRYLVVTRWRDAAAFEAWMASAAFQQGHAKAGGDAAAGGPPAEHAGAAAERPADAPADDPAGHPGGAPGGPGGAPGGGPAAMGSELWSFDVVTSSSEA